MTRKPLFVIDQQILKECMILLHKGAITKDSYKDFRYGIISFDELCDTISLEKL